MLVAPAPRAGGFWLATRTLWRRELVRFFRQHNRVASALITPLIFWLFLGSGLNHSFTLPTAPGTPALTSSSSQSEIGNRKSEIPPSVGYLEYFFPGTVVLIIMFTAIFSTISVIEDRREGFLQGVLVAPVPRLAIALGKVMGGASIAMVQGLLFLLLWPLVGTWPGIGWFLLTLAVMFLLSVGLTGLGLCIAWPMDSTAGFHAVMMMFLMPMWFLCGAVFPITANTPFWMKALMLANPLTYGQAAFTESLSAGRTSIGTPLPLAGTLLVTFLAAVGILLLAGWLVNRPRRDGAL